MDTTRSEEPAEPDEDERAKERYRELLEELRTIIPGAEVLLGFLRTVPFSNRFADVDRFTVDAAWGAAIRGGGAPTPRT